MATVVSSTGAPGGESARRATYDMHVCAAGSAVHGADMRASKVHKRLDELKRAGKDIQLKLVCVKKNPVPEQTYTVVPQLLE